MSPRLRFITALTAAALHLAVVLPGQNLHALLCLHETVGLHAGHECHASACERPGWHAGTSGSAHDEDSCPVCQARAQAQALPSISPTASHTALCQACEWIACDRLLPSPIIGPYLARGPPAG